jgi:hypothetical protein
VDASSPVWRIGGIECEAENDGGSPLSDFCEELFGASDDYCARGDPALGERSHDSLGIIVCTF